MLFLLRIVYTLFRAPTISGELHLNTINERMNYVDRHLLETKAASDRHHKDTFLSHSSQDAEYLPAVIDFLQKAGTSVYCDLDDNRMPTEPNPETALIIKGTL
jgi:hypothetical protein